MKKIYFSLCLTLVIFSAQSQITVSPKILPAAGDVYYYSVDTIGAGITMSAAGPNQHWDFSNFKANRSNVESYLSPTGLLGFNFFANANLATQNQGSTSFFRVTNKNLELLGNFLSGNPLITGPNVLDKPATILRTPLDYLDQFDYSTNQQFAISGKLIPDSLTMGISVDSIRIKIRQDVTVNVDGWGTVKLPASDFNVLRSKRTTTNNVTVEAKLAFVGWIDISAIAGPVFGGLLNAGNSVDYVFLSNDTKGFVATVSVDSTGNATRAEYKAENVANKDYTFDQTAFELESNVIRNELVLKNIHSNSSDYSIEIISMSGLPIYSKKTFVANGSSLRINAINQSSAKYEIFIRNSKNDLVWKSSYLKIN
ncbi:MAG: hypothetical protein ABI851_13620 [Saprospiraceae bacterium]